MKNSQNKHISSFNNPEYKFLMSLRKNRNRKSEMKSIAEGYRENTEIVKPAYLKAINTFDGYEIF